MKRWPWLVAGLFILSAPFAEPSPVQPHPPLQIEVPAGGARYFPISFNGQERALTIVSGTGASPLGLYVFDPHGNCVARDEALYRETRDDLAVEWFPPDTAAYTIEVRNAGWRINNVKVIFR
jgi:hypothetical protein